MSSLRGFNGEKRQTDILNQLIKIDSKTGVLPTGGASEAKQDTMITELQDIETKLSGTINTKLEDISSSLEYNNASVNRAICVGLRARTNISDASSGVMLQADALGRQNVNVLGNTQADGSGTPEFLHTDGSGNLNTQIINTVSVNGYRSNISSGATNQHALVNVAGYQYNKIYGNNSGSDVQLKCDANGVLETSGGGGGSSSSNSYPTLANITSHTDSTQIINSNYVELTNASNILVNIIFTGSALDRSNFEMDCSFTMEFTDDSANTVCYSGASSPQFGFSTLLADGSSTGLSVARISLGADPSSSGEILGKFARINCINQNNSATNTAYSISFKVVLAGI